MPTPAARLQHKAIRNTSFIEECLYWEAYRRFAVRATIRMAGQGNIDKR